MCKLLLLLGALVVATPALAYDECDHMYSICATLRGKWGNDATTIATRCGNALAHCKQHGCWPYRGGTCQQVLFSAPSAKSFKQ